tara:strand:- start:75 stop:593 length:519 start_codon:yes stop_codon:yes gene_type:complete
LSYQEKENKENKYLLSYWQYFAEQTKSFLTWKRIAYVIGIIALIVQVIGLMITPNEWMIWNVLTFIVATNLGAVLLAISAQKTADDIKVLYQSAFDADFYHTIYLFSRFKEGFVRAAEAEGNTIPGEISELSPQLYTLFKGYLETFEKHYGNQMQDSVNEESEYDEDDELFL